MSSLGRLIDRLMVAIALLVSASVGPAFGQERLVAAIYAGVAADLWKTAVAAPFQQQTGIRTQIFAPAIPSAAIAAAQGKPSFQVGLIASYQAATLLDQGALVELDPSDFPNLAKIPKKYWVQTADGKLAGIPVYFSYYGIAYNSDLAKAEDFSSWRALLDPKWKGRISQTQGPFAAAYDLTLFAKLNGGDERNVEPGYPMLQELTRQAAGVYTSMASLQSQMGRGEIVAAPFYANQIALMRRGGVKNMAITLPKEGGVLLSYLLVIPKGASNLEAAKKLINSAIAPEYQRRLAEGGSWPMNPETALSADIEADLGGTLGDIMSRNYSPDWLVVGRALRDRTRKVDELMQAAR